MTVTVATRERTVELFIDFLKTGRISELTALLSTQAVGRFPFSSGLFAPVIEGNEPLQTHFQSAFDAFEKMDFTIQSLSSDDRKNEVFARFTGTGAITGRPDYANTYLMVFTFDEHGLITEIVEYYNPMVTGSYFGMIVVEPLIDGVTISL